LAAYNDTNLQYPTTGGKSSWRGLCASYYKECRDISGSKVECTTSGITGYIPNLATQYISVLPVDPKFKNYITAKKDQCYLYASDAINYKVLAQGTIETSISKDDPYYDARTDVAGVTSAQVSTAEARDW
jgi:hypothetical protein